MSTNYVIVDCDGGSDDAWALLLLLRAQLEKRLQLLAVTICGCGNANLMNATKNMLRILKASDNENSVPVFMGASKSLIPDMDANINRPKFHGSDGFSHVLADDLDIDIENMVQCEHAVNAINRICQEFPKKVTIIAIGPLTNIALCYSMYDDLFANNVKDFFIMGGNHRGVGNATCAAEFNFHCDPEAAYVVLTKAKCPITILPWEACLTDKFPLSMAWRFDNFGERVAAISLAAEMLNQVESVQYKAWGTDCWNPCDAILVAVYLCGEFVIRKDSNWHATVDLTGRYTRGQMVLDHLREKHPKNVHIIEEVDVEIFKELMEWWALRTDQGILLKIFDKKAVN